MRVVGCLLLVVCSVCGLMAQGNENNKVDNKDKQFTLIKNDTTNASGIPVLKYKVIRNADKKMILEGSVTMGSIEWSAAYELEESRSLGAGQAAQNKRKIDLRPYLSK